MGKWFFVVFWSMIRGSVLSSVARFALYSAISLFGILAAVGAKAERPVIAVFAPGTGLVETLAAARSSGSAVIAYGSVDWIIALDAKARAARSALRDNGALLLLDAERAAALCGVDLNTSRG